MKNKILSSIATIALCLCLIAGSTFALFTYSTDVNIAVTAAEVNVTAKVDSLEAKSIGETATKDEYGVLHFANGGTAKLNGAKLELVKITPGDFVDLTVTGSNESNIAVKYRYVVKFIKGEAFASAITVKVNGIKCELSQDNTYYASQWLSPDAATGIGSVTISVGMETTVGNGDGNGNNYHDMETEIAVVLEAVQGNGVDASGNLING